MIRRAVLAKSLRLLRDMKCLDRPHLGHLIEFRRRLFVQNTLDYLMVQLEEKGANLLGPNLVKSGYVCCAAVEVTLQ